MTKRIHRGEKEYDELQRVRHENKQLKKALKRVRKQLDRIDMQQYYELKKLYKDDNRATKEADSSYKTDKPDKEDWVCHDCGKGVLRLIVLPKAGETVYLRKCDNCSKRTKLQKWTPDIKGV